MPYVPEKPPARLYKYQAFSARALTALKSRTVWFGRPASLNDPFDCAVPFHTADVTDEDVQRLLHGEDGGEWGLLREDRRYMDEHGTPTAELKRVMRERGEATLREKSTETYWNRGVACFSETPDDSLLWAHYGGQHRGLCLEFDTSSPELGRLHKVRYTDRVPVLNVVDELLGDGSFYMQMLLTKAACWAYEREWRAIHVEADKEYCYGVEALTGVYFGARLTENERDLLGQLLYGSPTKLFQVQRGDTSFRLEVHEVNYTPYSYSDKPPA